MPLPTPKPRTYLDVGHYRGGTLWAWDGKELLTAPGHKYNDHTRWIEDEPELGDSAFYIGRFDPRTKYLSILDWSESPEAPSTMIRALDRRFPGHIPVYFGSYGGPIFWSYDGSQEEGRQSRLATRIARIAITQILVTKSP